MNLQERLRLYIEHKGITTQEFERIAELSNGAVSKMGDNTRTSTLDKISKSFPDLNINWLRTGEGEMLTAHQNPPKQKASELEEYATWLLPLSAKGGTLDGFSASAQKYECEKIITPIKEVDFAITVTGDSMAPEYPSGAKVLIKRINERAFIDWGRVYVLDTVNGTVIKKIMPGTNDDCIRCVSLNDGYPDFQISFSDIHGMYRVLLMLAEK